jgi:hypothetical protein
MNVPGLPVTVLLDREGNEVARLLGGADWNGPDALKIIDALVAEKAPAIAAYGDLVDDLREEVDADLVRPIRDALGAP